ncbi:MAG: Dabb family protein [Candidatus Omnitrophica bacterium]|nr:Dabb family protein [Candidatus Omnitrophota bacterium]MBD3268832.1 Dabb family protein [Candidatus Omnitrophota bacterium]
MLKHIVMWKIKEHHLNKSKEQLVAEAKSMLEELPRQIPAIVKLEVGKNISNNRSAYDLVLYSEFKDWQSLETYRSHPGHLEVVEHLRGMVERGCVVDYQT